MESYYMGIDVSKGYADFVILDAKKNVVEPNFQLDDTFGSHCKLFEILKRFRERYPEGDSLVAAADVEKPFIRNYKGIDVKFVSLTGLINALGGAG